MSARSPIINVERLAAELETLASYSDTPAPSVTRVLFSDSDLEARKYIKGLLHDANLSIREDGLGNLFARWEGLEPSLPPVATGSHIDALPYGGRYDGTVGVLGGLEAIRALQEAGVKPRKSIELIVFTAEEPTRFGIGCLGSRALAGSMAASALGQLEDQDGNSLESLRQRAGLQGSLDTVQLAEGSYSAFIELHIEQGSRLEVAGAAIGVVTAIAAPAALRVTLEGEGGHAGTVLMGGRKDALLAAAETSLSVERIAIESGSTNAVGTVGLFEVYPGASNSIPSRVIISVDLRDTDREIRDTMIAQLDRAIDKTCKQRGITADVKILHQDPSAISHPDILAAIEEAASRMGLESVKLVSHAYHDTLFMGMICPTAMIFIPSYMGYSHRPEEFSSSEAIANGAAVLALALQKLTL